MGKEIVVGCPFCGHQPDVAHWHGGGPHKTLVGCSNDACHAAPAVTGATRAAAIRRWNARKLEVPDVLDPEDYDVWFALLYALADSCRSLVAAIEQISGKCQTREQRAALIIGRSALAALQRLERAGRVGDTTEGRGAQ